MVDGRADGHRCAPILSRQPALADDPISPQTRVGCLLEMGGSFFSLKLNCNYLEFPRGGLSERIASHNDDEVLR